MKTMTALAAVALGAMLPMAVTADVAELTLAIDGDSATVAAQAGALDPAPTGTHPFRCQASRREYRLFGWDMDIPAVLRVSSAGRTFATSPPIAQFRKWR